MFDVQKCDSIELPGSDNSGDLFNSTMFFFAKFKLTDFDLFSFLNLKRPKQHPSPLCLGNGGWTRSNTEEVLYWILTWKIQ